MGLFFAGIATTLALSTVIFVILIWRAPLLEETSDPLLRLDRGRRSHRKARNSHIAPA
jgi:hypothetical protein